MNIKHSQKIPQITSFQTQSWSTLKFIIKCIFVMHFVFNLKGDWNENIYHMLIVKHCLSKPRAHNVFDMGFNANQFNGQKWVFTIVAWAPSSHPPMPFLAHLHERLYPSLRWHVLVRFKTGPWQCTHNSKSMFEEGHTKVDSTTPCVCLLFCFVLFSYFHSPMSKHTTMATCSGFLSSAHMPTMSNSTII